MPTKVKEVTFTGIIDEVYSYEPKKRRANDEIDNEIKSLKKERESNALHEQNLDCAKRIYDMYQCYLEAGFSEDQAWDLIYTQVSNITK